MSRSRSEYRLSPIPLDMAVCGVAARGPLDSDRHGLASLMLEAYRGTIDDEDRSCLG